MSISEQQKKLYNMHLQIYRKHQNKPYRKRENFDDFEKEKPEEYNWLQKIDRLFNMHPQINIKLFFEAPYKIYEDQDYFNLNFYTSQNAIKTYTVYLKQINDQSPDNNDQIEFIKDSLSFIQKYCIEKNIDLTTYLTYIEQITAMWTVHLAEHKISPYTIIGLKFFNVPVYDMIFNIPEDERIMMISEIVNNYRIYENRLNNSQFAKKLIIEGIKIISQNINNHLQSKSNVVK